jgi:hypothetical protein
MARFGRLVAATAPPYAPERLEATRAARTILPSLTSTERAMVGIGREVEQANVPGAEMQDLVAHLRAVRVWQTETLDLLYRLALRGWDSGNTALTCAEVGEALAALLATCHSGLSRTGAVSLGVQVAMLESAILTVSRRIADARMRARPSSMY